MLEKFSTAMQKREHSRPAPIYPRKGFLQGWLLWIPLGSGSPSWEKAFPSNVNPPCLLCANSTLKPFLLWLLIQRTDPWVLTSRNPDPATKESSPYEFRAFLVPRLPLMMRSAFLSDRGYWKTVWLCELLEIYWNFSSIYDTASLITSCLPLRNGCAWECSPNQSLNFR